MDCSLILKYFYETALKGLFANVGDSSAIANLRKRRPKGLSEYSTKAFEYPVPHISDLCVQNAFLSLSLINDLDFTQMISCQIPFRDTPCLS
jgi:hypothetical protein